MQVKMSSVVFWVVMVVSLGCVFGENLQEECAGDFQKLMGCLSYATGKGNTPSKDCCSSVKGIRESEPKCLCYIMQQTHNGSAQVKSLGIQEAKLLQLPSACQLQNVSQSLHDCPRMLGISPTSPDAAIFTNTNATTAPTTTSSATTTPTPSGSGTSSGNKHGPFVVGSFVIAMLIHALSMQSH